VGDEAPTEDEEQRDPGEPLPRSEEKGRDKIASFHEVERIEAEANERLRPKMPKFMPRIGEHFAESLVGSARVYRFRTRPSERGTR